MSSITSSARRIEKVSSDNTVVAFDLLSNPTYMNVSSLGGLPRDRVLELSAQQRLKTVVFFDYVYLLAKRRFFPKIIKRLWLPNYPDKDKARHMFQDYRKMEETYVPYVAWMRPVSRRKNSALRTGEVASETAEPRRLLLPNL